MADASDDGWVVLSDRSSWRGLDPYSSRAALYGLIWLPLALTYLIGDLTGESSTALVVSLALTVVVAAAVLFITRVLLRRRVRVQMRRAELAVGKRVVAFSSIDRATVGYELRRRKLSTFLMFGEEGHPMASVCLRSAVLPELDAARRDLVADLLRQSTVAVPTPKPDPYDPKGRFAWMDHPLNLTRDEAIEFVLHTPESGEPVRGQPRPAAGFDD